METTWTLKRLDALLLRAGVEPSTGKRLRACVGCGEPTSNVERIEGIEYPFCSTHKGTK